MSSANPFNFFGGLVLEIGAAFAVLFVLWPLQSKEVRPSLQPADFFAARPVQYSASQLPSYDDLLPPTSQDQAAPQYPSASQFQPVPQVQPATIRQREPVVDVNFRGRNDEHGWREGARILPRTPAAIYAVNVERPAFEGREMQYFSQSRQQPRVAEAQPHVRTSFRADPPTQRDIVAPIRAYYPQPEYRTADAHGDYHNRY